MKPLALLLALSACGPVPAAICLPGPISNVPPAQNLAITTAFEGLTPPPGTRTAELATHGGPVRYSGTGANPTPSSPILPGDATYVCRGKLDDLLFTLASDVPASITVAYRP